MVFLLQYHVQYLSCSFGSLLIQDVASHLTDFFVGSTVDLIGMFTLDDVDVRCYFCNDPNNTSIAEVLPDPLDLRSPHSTFLSERNPGGRMFGELQFKCGRYSRTELTVYVRKTGRGIPRLNPRVLT